MHFMHKECHFPNLSGKSYTVYVPPLRQMTLECGFFVETLWIQARHRNAVSRLSKPDIQRKALHRNDRLPPLTTRAKSPIFLNRGDDRDV